MWNAEKSAKLSLYLTDAILVLIAAMAVCLPRLVGWYVAVTSRHAHMQTTIITVCYVCLPAVLILLYSLRRLLKNIMKQKIFISQNVRWLRTLSWCCVAVSIITLVAGYFYLPFYIVGIAAGFFSLILRIIKNVFNAAIDIKAENELTI